MQDKSLYQQILGLTDPWSVERVELNTSEQRVDVYVRHRMDARWKCPVCQRELGCYDHSEERCWRHLDTCQFKTYLRARVPRVNCPEHGVRQVEAPWAEPLGRFTMLFERFAIDVLQNCQTVKGACTLLRISWDQGRALMERAVERGLQRKQATPVERIGVDEKAFRKGHDYMTVVCDIDRGVVEYVSDGRTTDSLREFFESRSSEQLSAIQAVAMDMWEPYIQATLQWLPLAKEKIVFDRFHIMQNMTEAVDDVRKDEHRKFLREGNELLKGTKYLWLTSQENLSERQSDRLESLPVLLLKTGRAWAIKEYLRDVWNNRTLSEARTFFREWYSWAIRSRLEPVKAVARMLKRRLDNVLTYYRHWITNAVSEGLNSKIMSIKRRAAGFRNRDSFKMAIYFYCGGLDLYPR
jgi:transposase